MDLRQRVRAHVARFATVVVADAEGLGPGSWVAYTDLPQADHNMAFVSGATAAGDLAIAREAAEWRSALIMAPEEQAPPLAPAARELGLAEGGTAPLMVASLGAFANGGDPAVGRACDEAELAAAGAVMCTAFALDDPGLDADIPHADGVDVWMLRENGRILSVAVTTHDEDVVGVYAMGTPPEEQRRGHGARLLSAVLGRFAREGVERAYLVATPAGQPLYRRLGFDLAEEWRIWVAGESTQFAEAGAPQR